MQQFIAPQHIRISFTWKHRLKSKVLICIIFIRKYLASEWNVSGKPSNKAHNISRQLWAHAQLLQRYVYIFRFTRHPSSNRCCFGILHSLTILLFMSWSSDCCLEIRSIRMEHMRTDELSSSCCDRYWQHSASKELQIYQKFYNSMQHMQMEDALIKSRMN